MSCPDSAALAAYAEGRLNPEEDVRLSRHVRGCAECTRALRDLAARAATAVARTLAASQPPAPGSPAPIPERGTPIGRYLVLGVVGEGGMGMVLSAYDPDLHRRVAVKLIRVSLDGSQSSEELRERLRREAQTMARFSHPNVVAVHDVGPYGPGIYVAMEWVEGSDLWRWQAAPPRHPREILAVYLAAGEGLAAAHRAGVVHRDFKPDNVLVGDDGRVRVTDFGLARQAHRDQDEQELTGPGAIVGTPGYISPEQLRGGDIDGRADQFSFCASLYESLYGRAAFAGGNDRVALARSVLEGKLRPPPPTPQVPRYLWPILQRGLATDSAQRYPTMDALLQALRDDPRVRLRRRAVAVLALLATLGAGFGIRSLVIRDRYRCRTAAQTQMAAWSPARREHIGQVRVPAGDATAAADWARTAGRIDGYAQGWIEARTDVCEAERASGDSADLTRQDALRREEMCLVDLRRDFDQALTSLEAAAPSPGAVSGAALIARLDPPGTCRSTRTAPPVGGDADETLWQRLAQARVLYCEDHFDEAEAPLAQLITDARDRGARLVLARALLTEADLDHRAGRDPARAAADMQEGARVAEAAGDDPLVATYRLRAEDYLAASPPASGDRSAWEAQLVAARADAAAAVHRAGDSLSLRATELWVEGNTDSELNATTAAVAEMESALALSRQVKGAEFTTAAILNDLADAYEEEGDYARAERDFADGLVLERQILGPEAVDSAEVQMSLAWSQVLQGRAAEALPLMESGVQIFSRLRDASTNSYTAWAILNLGQTLAALGRNDEAWARVREASEIYAREDSPDFMDMANLHTVRGDLELRRGDLDAAHTDLEAALAALTPHRGSRRELAEAEFLMARLLAEQGRDLERAQRLAESARKRLAAAVNGDQAPLAEVVAWQREHGTP